MRVSGDRRPNGKSARFIWTCYVPSQQTQIQLKLQNENDLNYVNGVDIAPGFLVQSRVGRPETVAVIFTQTFNSAHTFCCSLSCLIYYSFHFPYFVHFFTISSYIFFFWYKKKNEKEWCRLPLANGETRARDKRRSLLNMEQNFFASMPSQAKIGSCCCCWHVHDHKRWHDVVSEIIFFSVTFYLRYLRRSRLGTGGVTTT